MPIFGSEDSDGTWSTCKGIALGTGDTSGAAGTADSITAYIKDWLEGQKVKGLLYNSSLVLIGTTVERTTGGDTGWHTFLFSEPKPVIAAESTYYCCIIAASNTSVDTTWKVKSGKTYVTEAMDYDNPESPIGGGWDQEYADYAHAVYCSYTEEGEEETHTPSDTAKASDSLAFRPGIPLSDTAKASDGLTIKAGSVLGDTAKASDIIAFIKDHKEALSDTAKASDSPAFKPKIPLSDLAKASDLIEFIKIHGETLVDTAKASDELTTIAKSVLGDTAKASDIIAFIKDHKEALSDTAKAIDAPAFKAKIPLSDTAKANDSVEFSYISGIETPTDDVQIFRNDLSL